MCLFGEILGRMENIREKSGKKEVLMGVWLGGGVEKNMMGLRCFLFRPTEKLYPQNKEKTNERNSLT